MTQADTLPLDELRVMLAPAVARAAVFDGWSPEAVRGAAMEMGVAQDVALYAFNEGAMAMIAAWIASIGVMMITSS